MSAPGGRAGRRNKRHRALIDACKNPRPLAGDMTAALKAAYPQAPVYCHRGPPPPFRPSRRTWFRRLVRRLTFGRLCRVDGRELDELHWKTLYWRWRLRA